MKLTNIMTSGALALLFSACAHAEKEKTPGLKMEVTKAGTQTSSVGPKEYFDGIARVDPVYTAKQGLTSNASYVTFEKGARSAWHSHPNGQTLIVTEGVGRVQEWGGTVQTIKKGDVIWTPPGVKHWHGAAVDSEMTHLSVVEPVDGKSVQWMEKVTKE